MKVLVSACLMGRNCKYNGGNNRNAAVLDFVKDKDVVEICPEMLSALGAPRKSVELVQGCVRSRDGADFTREFQEGVRRAMERIRGEKIDLAVLQSRSPSCGVRQIYDGTFGKRLIDGQGLFARALSEAGIPLMDAAEVPCAGEENPL